MPGLWNGTEQVNIEDGLNVKEWFRSKILTQLGEDSDYISDFIVDFLGKSQSGIEKKEKMITAFCQREGCDYRQYRYYYPDKAEKERVGQPVIDYIFNDALDKLKREIRISNYENKDGIYILGINSENPKPSQHTTSDKKEVDDLSGIEQRQSGDKYGKDEFLSEVYMSSDRYDELKELLERKMNVILQGAPGVGKTFAAKRLAYSIMGEKNKDRVKVIQFHQSYSYEDFIMGYRPNENGFKLWKGPFYDFCKTAEKDSGNPYYFIIDEINRGNLSKIFGELFMLIESDKRGESINCLLYEDKPFSVPKNLYIIGMLNTADRSLAMLDYALRRRFAFFELTPGFDTKKFEEYGEGLKSDLFDSVIQSIKDLNILIQERLGSGFCIGHSYFCNLPAKDVAQQLPSIIRYEIIPLIEEYCFDDNEVLKEWKGLLSKYIS